MAYIRYSTKIKGQKNHSRVYAWHDVDGGVVINCSRVDSSGQIRLSLLEMHHLCTNFMQRKYVKKNEPGFYTKHDKEFEQKSKIELEKFKKSLRKIFKKKP
jgi:hypothetical protein